MLVFEFVKDMSDVLLKSNVSAYFLNLFFCYFVLFHVNTTFNFSIDHNVHATFRVSHIEEDLIFFTKFVSEKLRDVQIVFK